MPGIVGLPESGCIFDAQQKYPTHICVHYACYWCDQCLAQHAKPALLQTFRQLARHRQTRANTAFSACLYDPHQLQATRRVSDKHCETIANFGWHQICSLWHEYKLIVGGENAYTDFLRGPTKLAKAQIHQSIDRIAVLDCCFATCCGELGSVIETCESIRKD